MYSKRVIALPPLPEDADKMIEAQHKEHAVFDIYKIYTLFTMEESVISPPRVEALEYPPAKERKV